MAEQKVASKSAILRGLRIEEVGGYFYVAYGQGLTYRTFGISLSAKGAKELRATVRKAPDQFGIV